MMAKLASGGIRYRAGWQIDTLQEAPSFSDFQRFPGALRRDQGPPRTEAALVLCLEEPVTR